jgi:hypothetical protein
MDTDHGLMLLMDMYYRCWLPHCVFAFADDSFLGRLNKKFAKSKVSLWVAPLASPVTLTLMPH